MDGRCVGRGEGSSPCRLTSYLRALFARILMTLTLRKSAHLSLSLPFAWAGCCLAAIFSCAGAGTSSSAVNPGTRETPEASQVAKATASRDLGSQMAGIMPRGLTSVGVATLDDALYLVGGYHGSPHGYSKEGQTGAVWRMDLSGSTWESLPGVEPLQSPAVVSDGKFVYKIGGLKHLNTQDKPTDMRSIAQAARFDPASNQWQQLPDLPEGRSSSYAVVVGSTLYVIGGWLLQGGMYDSTWSETLLTADLSRPQFEWKSEKMPFQIRAEGLVALDGKIYVLGGIAPEGSTDAVHIYDTKTRTWSDGPELPYDNMTTRGAVFEGRLYANGADGNVYRLNEDRWEATGTVRLGRLFHEMVSSQRGPLVLAGIPNNGRGGRVRLIERLTPEPSPAGLVLRFDNATAAKNRQGLFLWSQQLFVAGGNNSLGQHDFANDNFVSAAARLDLGALAWRPVEDFPAKRQSMQAVVVGKDEKSALVLGGFGVVEGRLATHADVFRYTFGKREWTVEASKGLPEGRSQFGLAEWGNAVWTFGGMNFDPRREKNLQIQHTAQILRLDTSDPEAKFLDAGVSLNEPRRAFAGAELDGKYYVVGGMKDGFAMVPTCEVVDLEARKTSALTCPSEHRLGAELVSLQGRLFLVGGTVSGKGKERESTRRIEVYEPARQRWVPITAEVPFDTTEQMRASRYQGQLLLFSSHTEQSRVQVALLDPAALLKGSTTFRTVDVPKPTVD